MKRIILCITFLTVFACSDKSSQESVNTGLDNSYIKLVIENGFVNLDEHNFSSQDSCWFRAFVNKDFELDKSYYIVSDDVKIFNCKADVVNFSFTVLNKDMECSYYGHADVYNLMYNKSLVEGIFTSFQNPGINDQVNKYLKYSTLKKGDNRFNIVKRFIYELYHESIDGIAFTQIPTDKRVMLKSEYFDSSYDSVMRMSRLNDENVDILSLESDVYGSLCFIIEFTNQNVLIEELIKPASPRSIFLRTDIVPQEYNFNCK